MNHNKKKAFTLLELLVVIAIVAVLSAVAVVGYSSFKKKAYISNDSTLVEQMNKIVAGYEVLDERARNMSEAIEQCQDNGFILENLDPQTPGYRFVYDQENNRFSLMDEDFKVSFTDEQKPLTFIDKTEFNDENKTTKENLNLFVILNDEKDWNIIQDYRTSVFVGINYDGEQFIDSTTKVLDKDGNPLKDDDGNEIYYKTFTYNRGVDAGKNLCKYLTIIYDNATDGEQITHEYPVVLRSSNLENLTIKSYVEESSSETSYCDTVYHYGSASNLNVINNGYHSVHEFGGAEKMTAPLGAVEFEDGCVVDVLLINAVNKDIDIDIDDGSQIGTLIIITSNEFNIDVDIKSGAFVREIIIAGSQSVNENETLKDAKDDNGNKIYDASYAPTNLTLTVEDGATVKASTKNDADTNANDVTTITGLPEPTTPRTVQETCTKEDPHIWATQPDLLVEFCKKCGARRTVEVIENSATKEVTETTTYTRADDTPKVQKGESEEITNSKATNYANAVLGKATSDTAEKVYVVEEVVDVEIVKEDDKPTGKQVITITDGTGKVISKEEEEPGKPVTKYVAWNNKTDIYYMDAELAINEADPKTDTIVFLADVTIKSFNIQNDVEVDLNGHNVTVVREKEIVTPATNSSNVEFINVGLFGYSMWADYETEIISNSMYKRCDGEYVYVYKDKWYKTYFDESDKKWFSDYPTYYASKIDYEIIETRTFSNPYSGNSTTLKYFSGGYGTTTQPYLISTFEELHNMKIGCTLSSEITSYFKLINDIELKNAPLEKEEYGDMFYWYSLKKGLDLDLGNHALLNLSCNMFYTPANLSIHDGVVNVIESGNLLYDYGNGGTNHTLTFKNLTLTGNIDTSLTHYGPLASFAGNNGNMTQCTTVICENISSYVNIKGTQTYVGGLFGYCPNTNMSLKNCNVYGNISTTGPVGGFFEGSQYHSCGCITTDGKGITKIENCAFYGTIIVPINGTAYYSGPNVADDTNYKATSASICKAIDISQKILLPDNLGETIQIEANSDYTKYVIIASFNVDYIDGRAGGYPQSIVYEIENSTTGIINTPLKKYQLIEGEFQDGDTKYDTQIVFRTSDNTLIHDGLNVYKLASYGVSVSVYAYTGDTLKAVGFAWYDAE